MCHPGVINLSLIYILHVCMYVYGIFLGADTHIQIEKDLDR